MKTIHKIALIVCMLLLATLIACSNSREADAQTNYIQGPSYNLEHVGTLTKPNDYDPSAFLPLEDTFPEIVVTIDADGALYLISRATTIVNNVPPRLDPPSRPVTLALQSSQTDFRVWYFKPTPTGVEVWRSIESFSY